MTLTDQFDKIKEQEWYQQIQASYSALPPEQQNYVKWGSFGALMALLLYGTYVTMDMSNSVKDEYYQKQELTQLVNQANDEMRRLKGQNSGFTSSAPQTWKAAIEGVASSQGLAPESVEIAKETPGPSLDVIQETLLLVNVKNASVHNLAQFLYQIEHGSPPMKLKGMTIETTADGNLNAKLNISGYMPKPEKSDKK